MSISMRALRTSLLATAAVLTVGVHQAAAITMNVARLGTATQSTTRTGSATQGDIAQVALDGNTDGIFNNGSVTHTGGAAGDVNAFWQVRLDSSRPLDSIELFNRADCCGNRLSNYRVSVFDGAAQTFAQDFFVGAGSVPQGGSFAAPLGVTGDRVVVQFLGTNNAGNTTMSLAEVQIFSEVAENDHAFFGQGRNVARLGTATQSSTRTGALGAGGGNKAILAIDGNTSGAFSAFPNGGSVTHTNNELSPFWQVELTDTFKIENIVIHERTDAGTQTRLNNYTVSILDANQNVIHQQFIADTIGAAFVAAPLGTDGKFVRVQMNNTGAARSLELAEVQVFGGEKINMARSPIAFATQSSEGFGGAASRAIDGITDGDYFRSNSVSHTGVVGEQFWQVDLGTEISIDDIVIYNRTDANLQGRLTGATLSVLGVTGNILFSESLGNTAGIDVFRFDLAGLAGRVVRIDHNSSEFLHLAEVQVFGAFVPEPTTATALLIALGGLAMRRRRHA